jgi:hypothetical protein
MTTPADDTAVEEAFEAYLAGRVVPAAGDGLVFFADAVRASATEPGRPSAALAELLATGLLTDLSSPSTATARPAPRRRRRIRMFLPALFAKLASAGLVAKAATATGIVVVGLSTAGFTGSLPDGAQHTFATVVDSVTSLNVPDPDETQGTSTGDGTTAPISDPTSTVTPTTPPTEDVQRADEVSGDPGEPTEKSGDTAEPARPSNYGQQVSEWAHERNGDRKASVTPLPPKPTKKASDDDSRGGSSRDAGDHASGDDGSDH